MILLLGFAPESFSETELKTVEIFVQPPTGLTTENDMNDDEQKPTPQKQKSPLLHPAPFRFDWLKTAGRHHGSLPEALPKL